MGYDRIEQLAKKENYGIKLLDHVRRSCVACAEGKQPRANQSKKDSGRNAPIEQIGGVICSDLKGPMSPVDRKGNRYMVNFVHQKIKLLQNLLGETEGSDCKEI